MRITETTPSFENQIKGLEKFRASNWREMSAAELAANGRQRAAFWNTERETMIPRFWNNNSIDAALQRQAILQEALTAYKKRLLALEAFCFKFEPALEGTDKVEVSYFPLQTTASTSFVKGTGYTTTSDWNQQKREVFVGGDGDSTTSGTNAATGTAKDRKFQMLAFTSYDLNRQPFLNSVQLAQQATNQLAVDVFTDIVSRIVTKANYGNAIKQTAAASFSADDVADVRETATNLHWPQSGRSLVLNHTYYTPLLKDPTFKAYLAYGSTDPIQMGRVQEAYGFENIFEVPNLTTYGPAGENLVGWMCHKSAALVAVANIVPATAVRNLLGVYELFVDQNTGLSFAHRTFGNATTDTSNNIVECSYGAQKGVETALNRFTSSGP
jgi:hypothetical protein